MMGNGNLVGWLGKQKCENQLHNVLFLILWFVTIKCIHMYVLTVVHVYVCV